MRKRLLSIVLALMCGTVAVALRVPLHSSPPGHVVQTMTAYLAGEAMNSRYRLINSRVSLSGSEAQPYLSIYAQRGDGFSEIYRSPSRRDALALVPRRQKMPGNGPFLPAVTLQLIGKAELMGAGRQQAVVLVHEASADCGSATVSILRSDPGPGPIRVAAQASNSCDLSAAIQGNSIVLTGPYYNATAALCCPTQAHARAVLTYGNGRWTMHPAYFKLIVRGMARARVMGPIPKITASPKNIMKPPIPSPGALQTPRP